MKHSKAVLLGIMSAFLPACGGGSGDGEVGSAEDAIVRGTEDDGHPQVVALLAEMPSGATIFCSGTYVAPRVVLTAAHCMPTGPGARILVYHGNNFDADLANLTEVPAPGTSSEWALADSWQTHPDWDPAIVYPDLAVVFLDRWLPMWPLPYARWRLEDREIGKLGEIVGWGASQALSEDIQQHEGGHVKRSGAVPFMGSPAQDPKPPHPHPGLDLPEVRAGLAMFNGTDPWPNTCAGDSGGPVIMKKWGHKYTFGVSSWTGDWCEGFSYHTRIDPFVGYLDGQVMRAGGKPIQASPICVSEQASGQLRAHIGYENLNGISLDIPYGRSNSLPQDTTGARPTHFVPGKAAFAVDFDATQTLTYRVRSWVGPASTVQMNASSLSCTIDNVSNLFCQASASLCGVTVEDCTAFTADTSWLQPACVPAYTDWVRCSAWVNPENYFCDEWLGGMPTLDLSAPVCVDETNAYWDCYLNEPW